MNDWKIWKAGEKDLVLIRFPGGCNGYLGDQEWQWTQIMRSGATLGPSGPWQSGKVVGVGAPSVKSGNK